MRVLGSAIELYVSDHQRYPTTLEQLVPRYLLELPACPGGIARSPRARVLYRARGFELSDGYGYRANDKN